MNQIPTFGTLTAEMKLFIWFPIGVGKFSQAPSDHLKHCNWAFLVSVYEVQSKSVSSNSNTWASFKGTGSSERKQDSLVARLTKLIEAMLFLVELNPPKVRISEEKY